MLQFRITDTEAALIVTLTELQTLAAPDYHFVFTHVTTKETVSLDMGNGEDESEYPERYNKFTINPSVEFANKTVGEWHYKVYENDADGELLEQGKLRLLPAEDFDYSMYEGTNTFKTYNG